MVGGIHVVFQPDDDRGGGISTDRGGVEGSWVAGKWRGGGCGRLVDCTIVWLVKGEDCMISLLGKGVDCAIGWLMKGCGIS